MFGKANQYGMVEGFGVRVKDEREKDRNHLVEVDFELPLTFELADEISPPIARDLFDNVKGQWQPKPEISSLVMNLAPATQLMTIREHPDLDPSIKIAGVSLRKIQAVKVEAGGWALKFKTTWTLGDPKEAITMIQRLKLGVYITLEEQAPKLDLVNQSDVTPGPTQQALVDGGGNVTSITAGKRRGRPRKKTPEQEAKDQEAEARRQLPPAEDPHGGDDQPDEPAAEADPASGD